MIVSFRNSLLSLCIAPLIACSNSNVETESNSGAGDIRKHQEVALVDFETSKQLNWLAGRSADYQRITSTAGNQALKIDFSSEARLSVVRIAPDEAWDLSVLNSANLAVDIENFSDVSIQVYWLIENHSGESEQRSISLAPKFSGTVYFPVSGEAADAYPGLWGELTPWQSNEEMMIWRSWRKVDYDRSQISAITFQTIGLLQNRSISIDNLRLRKNQAVDEGWLKGVVDRYGQNARVSFPLKVSSDLELKQAAIKELDTLSKSKGMPDRSKFGGYRDGPKLEGTGYFRTQKVKGKWWMVDPEGYLFFSHGPANVRMANLTTITGVDFKDPSIRVINKDEVTPEDSMGIIRVSDKVRETRHVVSDIRHNMFEWLPDYDDSLADHYSYRRSTHKGPVPHGETFSFYRANLERRYGETTPESYVKKWQDVTLDRMKDWGFTSFGNWVDPAFYPNQQVPYFANGWIIGDYKTLSGHVNHWAPMPDFFDPVFAERAKATIDVIAKDVKGSPWCVGVFIDNEKSWGEREGTVFERYGVILDALSKNANESPAKSAFFRHLKNKYVDMNKLNAAWNTDVENWNTFAQGVTFESFTDAQTADLSQMLEMLGEQYFKVVHGTLEKVLPNHLYMGARMANWGMPDEIIKASVTYSDVLSFNIYEEGVQAKQWAFLEEVDLPVVIGEFHIGTTQGSGMFQPGIVHASDLKDRARMYKNYMNSVLEKPYMVGAHWFQYVDEPVTGRAFDGENANIGFVTGTDIPYPELIDAVKDITSTLYSERYSEE
jgi:agarase